MADTVLGIGDSKIASHGSNSQGTHSLKKERERDVKIKFQFSIWVLLRKFDESSVVAQKN